MKKSLSLFVLLFVLFGGWSIAFAQVNLDSGLVAKYYFNGNANDESGNGNHGTPNGATLTADRFGNANSAYNFAGISNPQTISVPNSSSLQFTNAATFSIWICVNSYQGMDPYGQNSALGSHNLFAKNYDQCCVVANITGLSSGEFSTSIGTASGSNWAVDTIQGSSINQWINLMYVVTTTYVSIYANGNLIITNNGVSSFANSNTHELWFGRFNSTWYPFNGKMDDIRIYDRALTQQEITDLYEEGGWAPLNQGLVAMYPFNGNANDESGNGNHGTVSGASLTTDRFENANKAYNFDGVNDYISTSNQFFNNGWQNYTISGWFSSNNTSKSQQCLINTIPHNGTCLELNYLSNNKLTVFLNSNPSIGNWDIALSAAGSFSNFNNNTWYHYAFVKNGDNYKFYLNGVLDANIDGTISPISYLCSVVFGSINPSINFTECFPGKLDDIRIYNRTLNAQEIQALYEEQNPMLFTTECHDLNDNQVPQGWTFEESLPSANISGGQMNALVTDAEGRLSRVGVMPDNTNKVVLEWDGDNMASTWGRSTHVKLIHQNGNRLWLSNFTSGVDGPDSYVNIVLANSSDTFLDTLLLRAPSSFIATQYHYKVSLSSDSVEFCATNISNQTNLYNYKLSLVNEGIVFPLDSVIKITFLVGATTDNSNWLDNPCITIYENNCTDVTVTLDTTVCSGGSVTIGSNTYDSTGTYVDSLLTSLGCDSVITTNLTVIDIADIDQAGPQTVEKIFFSAIPAGSVYHTIYSMNTDGSNQQALFNDSFNRNHFAIAKNESKLVYVRYNNVEQAICKSNIDGSNEEVIWTFAGYVSGEVLIEYMDVSNDFSNIIMELYTSVASRNSDIIKLDLSTYTLTNLTNSDNYFKEMGVHYSPDNTKIAYGYTPSGWYAIPVYIYIMNADGTNQIQLTSDGSSQQYNPSFSPDGTKIVYTNWEFSGHPMRIMNIDGSNNHTINMSSGDNFVYWPSFSPDGTKIIGVRPNPNGSIVICDTNGVVVSNIAVGNFDTYDDVIWKATSNSPTVQLSNDTICTGSSEVISINNSQPDVSYQLYNGTTPVGTSVNGNGSVITLNTPVLTADADFTIKASSLLGSCSHDLDTLLHIEVMPLPIVNLGPDRSICAGQTVTLDAGIHQQYQWSTGAVTRWINVSPTATTSYSVTVNDNGCTASDAVIVNVSGASCLTLSFTTTPTICVDTTGSATVSVTGGTVPFEYQWSSGDTTATAINLGAGIYVVTVTDANGNHAWAQTSISGSSGPTVVPTVTNSLCPGGSTGGIQLAVSGGTPAYTFEWSTGQTTQNISGLNAGTFDVEVEDAAGCIVILSVEVQQPGAINIIPTITPATCGGSDGEASLSITGGTIPYGILWSNGNTTATNTGLQAGSYTVTVTDHNGCIGNTLVNIVVNNVNAPVIVLDSLFNANCSSTDGSAYVSISGGNPPYTILWTGGSSNEDLENVAPGVYDINVEDQSGCVGLLSVNIGSSSPVQQPICIVTVDSTVMRNMVVWEKQQSSGISHYKIYREGATPNQYYPIGMVNYDDMSEYTDMAANPRVRSFRYKISAVDACGTETALSDMHKTMHLTISQGMNQSFNLIWDDYEGVPFYTYYIHRHTNANGWEILDSLPCTLHSYTDFPPSMGGLKYMVSMNVPSACYPTSSVKAVGGPYGSSFSNMEDEGILVTLPGINETDMGIFVFPNPMSTSVTIEIPYINPQTNNTIEISDIAGKVVRNEPITTETNQVIIQRGNLEPGIYFIEVSAGTIYRAKLVVE